MRRLFGTDGVRGVANDTLTPTLAFRIGRALGSVLSSNQKYRPAVLVGMDTRISSDMLASSIAAGLCSVGADVISLGVVPTPAVAYLVGKYKARAGVMISASHNTYEYNGIKIFNEDGFKLPDELEEQIESLTLDDFDTLRSATGKNIGRISYSQNALSHYVSHLKESVSLPLDGLEIALDCANGSACAVARALFSSLGAKCHVLNDTPDGVNINHECGSTHIECLAKYVREHSLDAGIAFDGDADRCLCVDERGEVLDGDVIMAMLSLDMKSRGKLKRNTLVGTVMSNLGLTKFCEENEIEFISESVGDRYVLQRIIKDGLCFGGESCGHIIFYELATTGDGLLTALQVLSLMKRKGKALSALAKVMKKYPQVTRNVEISQDAKIAFYTDVDVKEIIRRTNEKIGENGRLLVRPSGTEPRIRIMVESDTQENADTLATECAKQILERLSRY